MTSKKKMISSFFCVLLVVAMALTTGCGEKKKENNVSAEGTLREYTVLGEGQTSFRFTVVDKEGNETFFEIQTDKTTVGDALLELGLIDGEEGAYGLYVKTVNGITADYAVDQTYWAFYVNGEYAMSGADTTNVEPGTVYSFKVEK